MSDGYAALLHEEIERRWLSGGRILDAMCRHALAPGGKLMRPVLLLESAVAVGGRAESVLPAALGTECGHVASLVHDDIIDGDETRRGRPAVHSAFGTDQAIVAGDALIFFLFQCLAECRETGVPEDRIVAALDVVARAGYDLCRGQSLESELKGDVSCDVDTYLEMIRLKTAALFRASCESGAILGQGPQDHIHALAQYGEHLGTAFQIHDDLLAYTSDAETTGKAAASDVRNRRLTLPVILAYQRADADDRARIEEIMAGDVPDAFTTMGQVIERTQAVAASRRMAWQTAEQARRDLAVLPPTPSRSRLARLATLAIDRDR
ncbi:serralysin [Acrocarpospora phusangensis]|uniref:Serralysin n=1 Tax=Acrocarpospora phusangensis TaxID=1070424 RepID=A0A919UN03_9ACTN|nr:polyprenyl synthetase family protein [Acrocarpospora phusangensis]GIH22235.1 serralysin [Acrocarpospora phusangensis]